MKRFEPNRAVFKKRKERRRRLENERCPACGHGKVWVYERFTSPYRKKCTKCTWKEGRDEQE